MSFYFYHVHVNFEEQEVTYTTKAKIQKEKISKVHCKTYEVFPHNN